MKSKQGAFSLVHDLHTGTLKKYIIALLTLFGWHLEPTLPVKRLVVGQSGHTHRTRHTHIYIYVFLYIHTHN